MASACLWILLSAETIGFVLFFDSDNYERMVIGIIPLVLGCGMLFSISSNFGLADTFFKKLLLIPVLSGIGIGSYVYKPTTEEVNCWYYLEQDKTFKVLFAETPERTFEVELTSEILKKEVGKDAIQYEGRDGYYCPETKVKVITSFGRIISAKIMSFRNSKVDKKVVFSSPTKIPLEKASGKLEILKPLTLRLWN